MRAWWRRMALRWRLWSLGADPHAPEGDLIGFVNPYFDGPMWSWFGLTHSSYLVLPRALLCGMPEWHQKLMVRLLREMEETYDLSDVPDTYQVLLRDEHGRFEHDPLTDYRHPPKLPYRKR